MTNITFKAVGLEVTVTCDEGASYSQAISTFERITEKSIKGMDFYANGQKVTDLSAPAATEILAVKSKHESASTSITFKAVGLEVTVECSDGASCSEAISTFERITEKALTGMDFYANGQKLTDLSKPAPSEILAVKSKHESAK